MTPPAASPPAPSPTARPPPGTRRSARWSTLATTRQVGPHQPITPGPVQSITPIPFPPAATLARKENATQADSHSADSHSRPRRSSYSYRPTGPDRDARVAPTARTANLNLAHTRGLRIGHHRCDHMLAAVQAPTGGGNRPPTSDLPQCLPQCLGRPRNVFIGIQTHFGPTTAGPELPLNKPICRHFFEAGIGIRTRDLPLTRRQAVQASPPAPLDACPRPGTQLADSLSRARTARLER